MMAGRKLSSREKIISSALSLFAQQGITATTTKEIAEQASVNEVTLFRQFGSKQGLLLAVLQEAPILSAMQASLSAIASADAPLMAYGSSGLALLGEVPELVRSLIGEAGQFPAENQAALGQALRQANQQTISYLKEATIELANLPAEEGASLLNTLLVGYAVMDFSSDAHGIWPSQEAFLTSVEALFLAALKPTEDESRDKLSSSFAQKANHSTAQEKSAEVASVEDLPEEVVRQLFQKAKKQSPQAYALVYVLFGAGLCVEEAAELTKTQSFSSKNQHLLTITGDRARQVPLNRWIMGNRYGTYVKNPLTQWLKTRQDDCPAIFVDEQNNPMGVEEITQLWETMATDVVAATGSPPQPFQARQTWCIELLMKGMSLENLSILSGLSLSALDIYARRAKAKTALEQALSIDQKSS